MDNGRLWIHLTQDAHGPTGTSLGHPMRGPAGVSCEGVPLEHNDVFRVVHDIYGHVLPRNTFSLRGELRAAYCHMLEYSRPAHEALFVENVAQICWFYCGQHLRCDDPPPVSERPFPPQKVYACSPHLFAEFMTGFDLPKSRRTHGQL